MGLSDRKNFQHYQCIAATGTTREHGRIQGGGGARGPDPPFLCHDIGFLTLAPLLDPPPLAFACRLNMDPPFSKILDPPLMNDSGYLYTSNLKCVYSDDSPLSLVSDDSISLARDLQHAGCELFVQLDHWEQPNIECYSNTRL